MGQDKLVLPWKDTTVLGYVIQTLQEGITLQERRSLNDSSCAVSTEIYVVARLPIEAYLTEERIQIFNSYSGVWIQVPSPKPLAETIRFGLQNLNSEVQSIGFLPGDQVGVTVQGLADCLLQVMHISPDFLVPSVGDKAGSPVFFHKRYVPELLALQGEQGGREVLYRYPELWTKHPVDESLFLDVDTPEQYKALRDRIGKD